MNAKVSTLVKAAIVTGLFAVSVAHAEHEARHAADATKVEAKDKASCAGKDKASCKGGCKGHAKKKKGDKASCKSGCKTQEAAPAEPTK